MEHDSTNSRIPDRDAAMIAGARRAVARWSGFPAAAQARPIVLLHSPVRVEAGFANGDAKIWFMAGAVEAAPEVPEMPVNALRASRSGVVPRRKGTLWVTAAVMGVTEYQTDRGPLMLPAWQLEVEEALGPIWVLAEEARARCWTPPSVDDGENLGPHMLWSATIGADDRSLRVEFIGGKEDLFRYEATVVETPSAVTVVPLERMTRKLPPGTFITLEGYRRQVQVILDEPLGGRAFVNLDATPVPVLREQPSRLVGDQKS